jgi:hypothetical protein
MTIQATQYLRPDGRKVIVSIERSPEIETLADELIGAGFEFELEQIGDMVHMEVLHPEDETAIAGLLVRNDSKIPAAVDSLVTRAHARWVLRKEAENES